jgi:HPt (histidine-containing phosphotransfer) domain-containing protein
MTQAATAGTTGLSISRLRTLILVALVIGISIYTAVMFSLVQKLADRFGPQVRADLEWRALRGSQELAKTADLGLVMSDGAMVKESFGAYAQSSDVAAIIARDASDALVAQHGTFDGADVLFKQPAGKLLTGPGYLASWTAAEIEGSAVGKIAVVVSTRRLTDAEALLGNVEKTALVAGIVGLVLGVVVILFFTRAVSQRDAQLNDYAHNLERKVDERTRELDERNRGMRLVLDNVAQGFITIDPHGVMASERSAIVDRWFGEPAPGVTLGALVGGEYATWLALGLDAVRDGFMPVELCLDQLPKRFDHGERTFDVSYSPILNGDTVERILVIVSDVTEQIVHQRAEREQRELVALFQRIAADRPGVEEFFNEANTLALSLETPASAVVEKRTIHTLKGNCAIYGLETFAELCHGIESELAESERPLTDEERQTVLAAWAKVAEQLTRLCGEVRREVVEVEHTELVQLIDKARQGVSSRDLAAVLASWSHERVSRRFERLGTHATALARRLGKARLAVQIDDAGIRLDAEKWSPFWGAMVHAVRNAVDHGVESAEARLAAGKPETAKLALTATRSGGQMRIVVADDGRGIDWDALRAKATAVGLPAATHADLVGALFADGVSTRSEATETSGRGVGMAALRHEVVALGGTIDVESRPGAGTTITCRFGAPELPVLRPPTQPIRIVRDTRPHAV